MSNERIGRVEGGTFVDERRDEYVGSEGETTEHLPRGYVDPERVIAQRMAEHDRAAGMRRVDEALETIEHVLASIGPESLTWLQVSRLTDVNERVLELYKAGLIALLSSSGVGQAIREGQQR